MEPDLSHLHGLGLVEVVPHRVDDVDVVHLVPLDAVGLYELGGVLDDGQRNVVKALAFAKSQVDVGRGNLERELMFCC